MGDVITNRGSGALERPQLVTIDDAATSAGVTAGRGAPASIHPRDNDNATTALPGLRLPRR